MSVLTMLAGRRSLPSKFVLHYPNFHHSNVSLQMSESIALRDKNLFSYISCFRKYGANTVCWFHIDFDNMSIIALSVRKEYFSREVLLNSFKSLYHFKRSETVTGNNTGDSISQASFSTLHFTDWHWQSQTEAETQWFTPSSSDSQAVQKSSST